MANGTFGNSLPLGFDPSMAGGVPMATPPGLGVDQNSLNTWLQEQNITPEQFRMMRPENKSTIVDAGIASGAVLSEGGKPFNLTTVEGGGSGGAGAVTPSTVLTPQERAQMGGPGAPVTAAERFGQQPFSAVPQGSFGNLVEDPNAVTDTGEKKQTAQDLFAGRMTFATGLRMLGEASQNQQWKSQAGALGVTMSGMAQMTGKAGKWAMPMAAISSFVFMQGQKDAQVAEARARQNFANAYAQALTRAGALYNG